jgi:hypothetical protein
MIRRTEVKSASMGDIGESNGKALDGTDYVWAVSARHYNYDVVER